MNEGNAGNAGNADNAGNAGKVILSRIINSFLL
jgi:hypothetical protein